jgi:hypothetical protein
MFKNSNLTKFGLEFMFGLESSQTELLLMPKVTWKAYKIQAQVRVEIHHC